MRDTPQHRELGFPVFSHSVSFKGTVKETASPLGEPVLIGGELVRPDASQAREAAEAEYIAAYRAGKPVIEVSGLAPVLAAKASSPTDAGEPAVAGSPQPGESGPAARLGTPEYRTEVGGPGRLDEGHHRGRPGNSLDRR